MRNNKKSRTDKISDKEALVRRVDAMMDPKLPDPPPQRLIDPEPIQPPLVVEPPSVSKPASEARTAPQLPPKLRPKVTTIRDITASPPKSASLAADKPKPAEKILKIPDTIPDPDPDNLPAPAADTSPPADIPDSSVDLDDQRTNEAVKDIVSHEGDVMLAVADASTSERGHQAEAEFDKAQSRLTLATFLWFLVAVVAVLAILLVILMVTGGDLNSLKSSL